MFIGVTWHVSHETFFVLFLFLFISKQFKKEKTSCQIRWRCEEKIQIIIFPHFLHFLFWGILLKWTILPMKIITHNNSLHRFIIKKIDLNYRYWYIFIHNSCKSWEKISRVCDIPNIIFICFLHKISNFSM